MIHLLQNLSFSYRNIRKCIIFIRICLFRIEIGKNASFSQILPFIQKYAIFYFFQIYIEICKNNYFSSEFVFFTEKYAVILLFLQILPFIYRNVEKMHHFLQILADFRMCLFHIVIYKHASFSHILSFYNRNKLKYVIFFILTFSYRNT